MADYYFIRNIICENINDAVCKEFDLITMASNAVVDDTQNNFTVSV